jgi:tetratricopeptide (TPR) repeat protein
MKYSILFLVGVLLLASGCAQFPGKPLASRSETSPASAWEIIPDSGIPGDSSSLSSQVLYQFLLAEIAGQRGDLAISADAYLKLARNTRDPRIAKRATEIALYAKQNDTALEAASFWLTLEPNSTPARQSVVALLVNASDLAAARPHLESLLQAEGGEHAFLQLNTLLARHEDKDAVLALVRDLAQPYPQSPEAQFALAQAAWNANRIEVALHAIREAMRLRPEWALGAVFQSQILAKSGDNNGALALLENYLQSHSKAAEVRLHYSRLLVAQKRYGDARVEFNKLMGDFPENPDVTLAVGLLSLQLKDYEAAQAQLKKTLQLGHKDPDSVRLYLGQINDEQKSYEDAKKWYGSVPRGKHYLEANIRFAGVLAKEGKLVDGRQHLSGLPAQSAQERVQLIQAEAQLLRDNKAYQEAFALLSEALQKNPKQPDLLYDRAMAAEKLDRLDVLESDLRNVIELKPDSAHAYNALGYTLADRNQRLDEAQQLIERALKMAPEDPFILDSMGWIKYRRGEIAESLRYLKRAYAERPDPEIAAHLGEVLWVSGSRNEAEGVWRGSLEEHPENEALKAVIAKFLPQ